MVKEEEAKLLNREGQVPMAGDAKISDTLRATQAIPQVRSILRAIFGRSTIHSGFFGNYDQDLMKQVEQRMQET